MASGAVIGVQIGFIVLIYIMAFVAGILPGIIPWCKKSVNVLGIANAFSGGIFLSIAFMHIMPEVSGDYNTYMEEKHHHHDDELGHGGDDEDEFFPLPFALVFIGYAFILLIDKVIFDTHSLVGEHTHGHVHDPVQASFMKNAKNSFIKFQRMVSGDDADHEHNHDCDQNLCLNESQINEGIKQYLSKNDKFAVRMSVALRGNRIKKQASKTFIKKDKGLDDDQVALFADKDNINLRDTVANGDQPLIGNEQPPKRWCSCNLTPVVLMIALSTHAVFEGIAVGLAPELSKLWTFIIAISLHKWAAAMSLGISMVKNFKNEKKTMYILLCIFAFATPLGISIGMLLSSEGNKLLDIIFSSLAGGTFVYIACSEVIVEEFSTPDYKWVKMVFFLLGAGLITGLNFIES